MCNLNTYSSEKLKERHLTDLLQLTALHIPEDRDEQCEVVVESVPQANIAIPYKELIVGARHRVEDFVVDCMFAGKPSLWGYNRGVCNTPKKRTRFRNPEISREISGFPLGFQDFT